MGKKDGKGERGLLSLEACISVTIFIFLMLFMYSFFILFEARNIVAHATLSAANAVALDAYETSNQADYDTLGGMLTSLYKESIPANSDFVDNQDWYRDATQEDASLRTGKERDAVKTRFLAYLGGGDTEKATKILKRLHIRGGADGLDFSKTRVEGKKLYVTVSYTIDLEYNIFAPKGLKMEHTACSKIWGK